MTDVAFVISNDRHHPAMFAPVIAYLGKQGQFDQRVISLCEMRGIASPNASAEALGVQLQRVLPLAIRRGTVARTVESSKGKPRWHRRLQSIFWSLILRPRLSRLLVRKPLLVVLPNDAAFPYNRLVEMLARRDIPYLLVQEGIRFPLPGVPSDQAYGRGGAVAIAAWGESSASYFRKIGVEASRVHLTGNPRFDQITSRNGNASNSGDPKARNLLLVTNPIDEQGFCTKNQKLELTRRFIDGIEELITTGEVRITLKLHASESRQEYATILESSPASSKLVFAEDTDLYPLLEAADAVVIMASTVGLEAILFGRPVGVLDLPSAGFVFDYVSTDAAMGLTWSRPLASQVRELLTYDSPGAVRFLKNHLATTHQATENISRLVTRFASQTK